MCARARVRARVGVGCVKGLGRTCAELVPHFSASSSTHPFPLLLLFAAAAVAVIVVVVLVVAGVVVVVMSCPTALDVSPCGCITLFFQARLSLCLRHANSSPPPPRGLLVAVFKARKGTGGHLSGAFPMWGTCPCRETVGRSLLRLLARACLPDLAA